MVTIEKLTSGFWAVFVDGTWIDASSATREQAEKKAEAIRKGKK